MSTKRKGVQQAEFGFPEWGGVREGAGRKRVARRARVEHRPRSVKGYEPLLVTTRLVWGLPSLRRFETVGALRQALRNGSEREGFRLVHYSLQTDHVHAIVEATDARALAAGMKGLLVRIARTLNVKALIRSARACCYSWADARFTGTLDRAG